MLLGDGNDRGMQLPQCCHLCGTTVVFEIFKGHAQDCHWQGLRQFTAMLGVELKPMFRQLGLRILARTAKFAVNRCFHDDPGAFLSGVIEISKTTSQSAAFTLATCRNAFATWKT